MAGTVGRWARGAAALTAVAAWAGLAIQLVLILHTMAAEGVVAALWRYLGFFTILTNLGVAIVASAMALTPAARLSGPSARLVTVAAIVFVGITFSVALRGTWSPTGWQGVANHLLHDATPLLFLLAWTLFGHGTLKWRDAGWTLIPPGLYCLYALARGAADGWYAYWFLDPAKLGLAKLSLSIAILLAALLVIAFLLVAADKWLGRRTAEFSEPAP
jgi:hypothetical protein